MHGYLHSTTRTASFVLVLSIFTYNYVSRRNNTLALFTHAHTPTRTGGRLTSGKVDRSSFRCSGNSVCLSLSSTCVSEFRSTHALQFPLSCVLFILFTFGSFVFIICLFKSSVFQCSVTSFSSTFWFR